MKKRIFAARSIAVLVLALTVYGCDSGGSGEDAGPLKLAITNPAGATEIETPDFIVNLRGTANSPADIEAVSWTNDRGGRGTANGKENWSTGNIVLQVGSNNITVNAIDIDGNTDSKSLTVIRESAATTVGAPADAVAMYSYNDDLSNPAPVEGANLLPRPVYFFLEPSSDWIDRRMNQVDFRCCKGLDGPGNGEGFAMTMSVSFAPWSLRMDLSNLQPGGMRQLRTIAHFGDGSENEAANVEFVVSDGTEGSNSAPTISGNPPKDATVGSNYRFQPVARDSDGDSLSFSISNKPSWATFSRSTGLLQGKPTANDIGTHGNIKISVSDGQTSTNFKSFSITVIATASGTATITWAPPTERTDNSPLGADLAGYKIQFGRDSRDYSDQEIINNPGITTFVVENLSSGTWYFAVKAKDSSGQFSTRSNEMSLTIQ